MSEHREAAMLRALTELYEHPKARLMNDPNEGWTVRDFETGERVRGTGRFTSLDVIELERKGYIYVTGDEGNAWRTSPKGNAWRTSPKGVAWLKAQKYGEAWVEPLNFSLSYRAIRGLMDWFHETGDLELVDLLIEAARIAQKQAKEPDETRPVERMIRDVLKKGA